MERKGLYMDFLFSSKDKFKKFLEERVNKIKNTIKKVEIGKDNVNLYYRITFITKNLNK